MKNCEEHCPFAVKCAETIAQIDLSIDSLQKKAFGLLDEVEDLSQVGSSVRQNMASSRGGLIGSLVENKDKVRHFASELTTNCVDGPKRKLFGQTVCRSYFRSLTRNSDMRWLETTSSWAENLSILGEDK